MNYTIEEITGITGCHCIGNIANLKSKIDTLLTDSRSLTYAETTLFFALKTKHGDGHKYIKELYDAGVRNFVCEEGFDTSAMPLATFLLCPAPLKALQSIATHHRKECNQAHWVGITGSNGKTIVKEWIYQLVGNNQPTVRSPKSYNSQIGVALSTILAEPTTKLCLIEAGISEPSEMQNLAKIIMPQTVVVTNIGSAHQENFASELDKSIEKLKLALNAYRIVFPADDDNIIKAIVALDLKSKQLFGWTTSKDGQNPLGSSATYNSIFVENISSTDVCTTIKLHTPSGQEIEFTIPFIDSASIQNSITAFCTTIAMGYSQKEIADRMSRLEPIAMRLEVKEGVRGLTIINDSYNSDINSLSIALDFMERRTQHESQKSILILSDILQGGGQKTWLYPEVAKMIERQHIDHLITIGPDLYESRKVFKGDSSHYIDTNQFLGSKEIQDLANSMVLIKGARPFHFDRITAILEKRVHETILEVNLNAIVDNLNHYRAMMKPTEKIVCMVKASAYGAGSIEVSKTLQDHKVDYLAVAVADEGVALRQGGINGHIMIMNPETTSFDDLFKYRLEPEIYSFKLLHDLITAASRQGITDFPVHIKLDTGMHRLGFNPETDMELLISTLKNQKALKPNSIFSHFVGSDDSQFDDFTHQQFALFDSASKKIQQAFDRHILRHICNSAGIERFPQYHLDMVRLGIGLYGINPYDNSVINTISALKTTILQIKNVPATDTVGYSRWGKLTRASRIAAIPIGYADGLDRHLGRGRGYCLVNGQKAYYVGNICMDVCMIDVTDIDCKEGDMVEIFGPDLPVTTLSALLDTIPYEILTSVSERVKRVYFT